MRHRRPPSQSWPTFLANHVQQIIRPPPTACGARCRGDDASDRRMDRSATSRSVPMRRGAALSDSRSGSCLRGRSRDRGSDGDYPSAHGTTFAVAKRSHRTLYRIRAAGVPRSRHHLQRQRPTTHLEIVHGILRTVAHALGTSEGRTGFATCLTIDHWPNHCDSTGPRASSSVRGPRNQFNHPQL